MYKIKPFLEVDASEKPKTWITKTVTVIDK